MLALNYVSVDCFVLQSVRWGFRNILIILISVNCQVGKIIFYNGFEKESHNLSRLAVCIRQVNINLCWIGILT